MMRLRYPSSSRTFSRTRRATNRTTSSGMSNPSAWAFSRMMASEIKKQVTNFTKKAGSVYGHNEKVTLTPSAPDIKAVEAENGARMFRNHIMGRFGYPEFWYGGGGDVNRATATEMDAPAIKMLTQKQNFVKYALEEILGHQVRQARRAGYLRTTTQGSDFSVITPQMQGKDVSKFGSTVQQVSAALVSAEMQGWVDKDTARKLFGTVMGFIGVEMDYEEVKKAVEKEQETKGFEDYLKKNQGQDKLAQALRAGAPSGPEAMRRVK